VNIVSALAIGHYVAGLVDGEGCFIIKAKRPRADFSPALRIEMHKADRPLLEHIQGQVGGTLKERTSPSRGGNTVLLEIVSREDCLRVIEILDAAPLRGRKKADYAVWREFVTWWAARRHNDPWLPGAVLHHQLIEGRTLA
jgi:hypothetical protein